MSQFCFFSFFTTLISPSLSLPRHHLLPHHPPPPPLEFGAEPKQKPAVLTPSNPHRYFKVLDIKDGRAAAIGARSPQVTLLVRGTAWERRVWRRGLQKQLLIHELLITSALITFLSNEENKPGSCFIIGPCHYAMVRGEGRGGVAPRSHTNSLNKLGPFSDLSLDLS